MAREFVGESANGCKVFVDTEGSHAATHMADTPDLLEYVKEAIPNVSLTLQAERIEYDMGRIVGSMDLVEVTENDEVYYAKRPNRDRYTKFVKNRESIPTSSLVLRLEKSGENEYDLFTTYLGELTPPFPFGDERDKSETIDFWEHHALVQGNQEILPETITNNCPW